MKHHLFYLIIFCFNFSYGQGYVTIISDAKHLAIVNENGAVRLASESAHNSMLKQINQNLDNINLNITSLVIVQQVIHRSLTEVNSALKTGRSVMQVSSLITEINKQSNSLIAMSKDEPWLLLVAEGTAKQLKVRGINLASEVSDFVLKEGKNVLMDYEKRDFLMRKIIIELKVMRALLFSMERAVYWTKINGLLKTVNPFKNFINKDIQKANEILRNYEAIKH
ncbi:hypothetical protein [Sphingobacterium siyangense]|uniref:Plasmid transfer protein n=1 Tax=Sphingobacterium siyangense TaxID=459529 RepID=A0A562M6X0_9SPHI|nr:hypothetical protein [Sphingobacterium siyangense]TWI15684.1 hypothetical protein IQ31_04967 [Sphingobacterium siyangense]